MKQEFTVELSTSGYVTQNTVTNAVVKMVLKDPVSLTKEDDVWGFCDGRNIYISKQDKYSKRMKYDLIHFLGRYCLFQSVDYVNTNSPGMVARSDGGFVMTGGSSSAPVLCEMVTDINNGNVFQLTKSSLIEILQTDPELLAAFNNEKRKKKKLVEYIKLYSEKHGNQIYRW